LGGVVDRQAVEFGVEIGEYRAVVRVPRRVVQRLPPERCVEAYHLQRTPFVELGVHRIVNTGFQTAQARVVGNVIEAFSRSIFH
jgi:hypothetical protein